MRLLLAVAGSLLLAAPPGGISGRAANRTISGNVTAGAVVQLRAGKQQLAVTTAGATGEFLFAGLAAGTYVVTPAKPGCTFTPAARSVTVGARDVAGITFTAACASGKDGKR